VEVIVVFEKLLTYFVSPALLLLLHFTCVALLYMLSLFNQPPHHHFISKQAIK
jgi:hypothetical protein